MSVDFQVVYQRFWGKIDSSGGPLSCWLWKGRKDKDGYGVFWNPLSKSNLRANRGALLFSGVELGELQALHSCDNPSCCNPAHLKPGTNIENHRQKAERNRAHKGRKRPPNEFRRGEEHVNAKITADIVRSIRAEYIPRKVSFPFLAKKYGISISNVHLIVARKAWAHVE